jgi:hypothetical protein
MKNDTGNGNKATEIFAAVYDKGDPTCPDLKTALDALTKVSEGIPNNSAQAIYHNIPAEIYALADTTKGSPVVVVEIVYANGKRTRSVAVEPTEAIIRDMYNPAIRDMRIANE